MTADHDHGKPAAYGGQEIKRLGRPPKAEPGRRLMPAELAQVAAEMGLPVSEQRYAPETTESKNRRATAYAEGRAMNSALRKDGVPKHHQPRVPKSK
jgi:hypothetical protein